MNMEYLPFINISLNDSKVKTTKRLLMHYNHKDFEKSLLMISLIIDFSCPSWLTLPAIAWYFLGNSS